MSGLKQSRLHKKSVHCGVRLPQPLYIINDINSCHLLVRVETMLSRKNVVCSTPLGSVICRDCFRGLCPRLFMFFPFREIHRLADSPLNWD